MKTSGGLPLWAKALLTFFVVGLLATVVGAAYLAAWLGEIPKRSADPEYINKVINSIAKIDSLPGNFERVNGVEIGAFGASTVLLRYGPDGTTFWLMRTPSPRDESARQTVDQGAEMAMNGKGTKMTVTAKGAEPVAGEQMEWIQGPATVEGHKIQEFVGVVALKDKHSRISLIGTTPGDTYNMAATRELLHSIKGF